MRFLALIAGGFVGYALSGAVAAAQTSTFPLPEIAPAPPAVLPPAATVPAPNPASVVAQPTGPAAVATPAPALKTTTTAVEPSPAPIPTVPAVKPAAKKKPAPPPLETALSTDPEPSYQPDTYFATLKAAERYADIVKTGGWPTDIVEGRPHSMGPNVAELRKRLSIEGDLPASEPIDGPAAEIWDNALTEAVKRFQSRMGLRPTGLVKGQTLKEIDVPAEARAAALAASAERMNGFTFSFSDRYVFVNLPSTSVEAVENGQVVHRYVAIVGDPEHPSPQIAAHISEINLNPTWTLPVSIIKKEIIPRMQRDPGYLTRQKIRILDGAGQQIDPKSIDWSTNRAANFTLRQDSGAGNSLGSIRIGMPNKLAVYMHDTPGKRLFGADYRFLSHGCVRVQGVYDYAEWLLQGTPTDDGGVWDKAAMTAKVKDGARLDIKVAKSVPVIWLYLTGWANNDGVAHFRDDVYGLDNPAVAKDGGDVASVATPRAAASPAQ
jgi:murein L,D-transpeptidase YcbB/YkuD